MPTTHSQGCYQLRIVARYYAHQHTLLIPPTNTSLEPRTKRVAFITKGNGNAATTHENSPQTHQINNNTPLRLFENLHSVEVSFDHHRDGGGEQGQHGHVGGRVGGRGGGHSHRGCAGASPSANPGGRPEHRTGGDH